MIGVERTESRRRMKETKSKAVSGVAGRSMTRRVNTQHRVVSLLVAYSKFRLEGWGCLLRGSFERELVNLEMFAC
jgi:hypothetical protein